MYRSDGRWTKAQEQVLLSFTWSYLEDVHYPAHRFRETPPFPDHKGIPSRRFWRSSPESVQGKARY